MKRLRTLPAIERAVGGLTRTTKMPGLSYSLSARDCNVGRELRQVEGSVCERCYAMKGNYQRPCVVSAHARRKQALKSIRQWTENMVELLTRKRGANRQFFRWHDSGDLQSFRHLLAIVEIAERVPDVTFWLPTHEPALIRRFLREKGPFPKNLVVRISAPLVHQTITALEGVLTSTVDSGQGFLCPAYDQGGQCGSCRACWNPNVPNVDYRSH